MLRGSRPLSLGRVAGAFVCATAFLGCGSSLSLRAAEDGNLVELRRVIAEETRRGELSAADARAIAHAIASAEVERATGQVGADRIRELQTCAKEVDDALERRAAAEDEVAAVAALMLLDADLVDPEEMTSRSAAVEGRGGASGAVVAWRAVRARSLSSKEASTKDGPARRKLMLDGDQEVRVNALRAAVDAADPADTDALIEAARLDPHQLARTLAIRALGAIGGERVVLALKDIWALADEPRRQVIAVAWAAPRALNAGGRRELLWAAETQRGALAVAAAIAIVRVGGPGVSDATGILARAIASGPSRDRIYAINVSPLSAEPIREAIVKAQADPDEAVALAAMARRVESSGVGSAGENTPERAAILTKITRIASGNTALAERARGTLARARVKQVLPLLEKDAQSKDARVRHAAGSNLVAMGELARASVLVADVDPHVRTSVACAILSAPP